MHKLGVGAPHQLCIGSQFVLGDTGAPCLTFYSTPFGGGASPSRVRRQYTERDGSSEVPRTVCK